MHTTTFQRYVREAGSIAALARRIGVSSAKLYRWQRAGLPRDAELEGAIKAASKKVTKKAASKKATKKAASKKATKKAASKKTSKKVAKKKATTKKASKKKTTPARPSEAGRASRPPLGGPSGRRVAGAAPSPRGGKKATSKTTSKKAPSKKVLADGDRRPRGRGGKKAASKTKKATTKKVLADGDRRPRGRGGKKAASKTAKVSKKQTTPARPSEADQASRPPLGGPSGRRVAGAAPSPRGGKKATSKTTSKKAPSKKATKKATTKKAGSKKTEAKKTQRRAVGATKKQLEALHKKAASTAAFARALEVSAATARRWLEQGAPKTPEARAKYEKAKAQIESEQRRAPKYEGPTARQLGDLYRKSLLNVKALAKAMGIGHRKLQNWLDNGAPNTREAARAYEKAKAAYRQSLDDWQSFKELMHLSGVDQRVLEGRGEGRGRTGVFPLIGRRIKGVEHVWACKSYVREGFLDRMSAWVDTLPTVAAWKRWQGVVIFAGFGRDLIDIQDEFKSSEDKRNHIIYEHENADDFVVREFIFTTIFRTKNQVAKILDQRIQNLIDAATFMFIYQITFKNYRLRSKSEQRALEKTWERERERRIYIGDLAQVYDVDILAALLGKGKATVRKWLRDGGAPRTADNEALIILARQEIGRGEWKDYTMAAMGTNLTSDEIEMRRVGEEAMRKRRLADETPGMRRYDEPPRRKKKAKKTRRRTT